MDEVTLAATTAATAFVTEMTREAYHAMRDAIARLLRRDGELDAIHHLSRLDQDRATLAGTPEDQRAAIAQDIIARWASTLEHTARTDHAIREELLALAASLRHDVPAARGGQHNHGPGTFVGGHVIGGVTNNYGASHDSHG